MTLRRFVITAGIVSLAAATVAIGVCLYFGWTSGPNLGSALIIAALLVMAAGGASPFADMEVRGSFAHQYMRNVEGDALESWRQDMADSNRNLNMLWLWFAAAVPLAALATIIMVVTG